MALLKLSAGELSSEPCHLRALAICSDWRRRFRTIVSSVPSGFRSGPEIVSVILSQVSQERAYRGRLPCKSGGEATPLFHRTALFFSLILLRFRLRRSGVPRACRPHLLNLTAPPLTLLLPMGFFSGKDSASSEGRKCGALPISSVTS
jgi:hypothetical protein